MSNDSKFILFALIASLLVNQAFSISCYQCGSATGDECDYNPAQKKYEQDCTNAPYISRKSDNYSSLLSTMSNIQLNSTARGPANYALSYDCIKLRALTDVIPGSSLVTVVPAREVFRHGCRPVVVATGKGASQNSLHLVNGNATCKRLRDPQGNEGVVRGCNVAGVSCQFYKDNSVKLTGLTVDTCNICESNLCNSSDNLKIGMLSCVVTLVLTLALMM